MEQKNILFIALLLSVYSLHSEGPDGDETLITDSNNGFEVGQVSEDGNEDTLKDILDNVPSRPPKERGVSFAPELGEEGQGFENAQAVSGDTQANSGASTRVAVVDGPSEAQQIEDEAVSVERGNSDKGLLSKARDWFSRRFGKKNEKSGPVSILKSSGGVWDRLMKKIGWGKKSVRFADDPDLGEKKSMPFPDDSEVSKVSENSMSYADFKNGSYDTDELRDNIELAKYRQSSLPSYDELRAAGMARREKRAEFIEEAEAISREGASGENTVRPVMDARNKHMLDSSGEFSTMEEGATRDEKEEFLKKLDRKWAKTYGEFEQPDEDKYYVQTARKHPQMVDVEDLERKHFINEFNAHLEEHGPVSINARVPDGSVSQVDIKNVSSENAPDGKVIVTDSDGIKRGAVKIDFLQRLLDWQRSKGSVNQE